MAKYKCETPCYHKKRTWVKGETIIADKLPNKHFKEVNVKYVQVEVEENSDNEAKTFSEYQKKVEKENKKAEKETQPKVEKASTNNFLE